jgi:hypothetical protein
MNEQSFYLNTLILKSTHSDYKENKYSKIYIIKKIGEGSYGIVFLIKNNSVIKIFKNSTFENTILNESNYLIPTKHENRELIFFLNYIKEKIIENKYIINIFAIGLLKDIIVNNNIKLNINSYFIILPQYTPFYSLYNIYNTPLIDKKYGLNFTLNIMKKMTEISYFIENKYNLINLDSKLSNFMFKNTKNNNIIIDKKILLSKDDELVKNLKMIDFSIIKTKNNKKYNVLNKYYIWPNSNNVLLEYFPSYITCINGLELLFGYDNIKDLPNNDKINYYLSIIKNKNINIYNIFVNGLILKINTMDFLELFN